MVSIIALAQDGVTVNGYVKDATSGEGLIGATVYVNEIESGTITNPYGYYSITLSPGTYTIEFRYIGFITQQKTLDLQTDQRINIELNEENVELEEIIVLAEAEDVNVSGVQMSVEKLNIKTLERIPAFLGEVDVIRGIQQLPGVSTVGEGAAGFNVRGGSVGQNLVLLDDAPVYNASHLLGFFSIFNPDAVKDVKLYKGAIPARFGGRLSSILDIRMKEGNSKELNVEGGVGTIFSRLTVEAPLVKDKASFIIAGRRSYIDVLAKPFTDALDDGAALNFYDLTLKTNYRIDRRNQIFLSAYLGKDNFKFDEQQGFNWGNRTTTFRWNREITNQLLLNLTAFFSDYRYELAFGEDALDRFDWNSRIRTTTLKPQFTYFITPKNELSFGGEALYYRFDPANAVGVSNGEVQDLSLDRKYAVESAAYIGNEQTLGERIKLKYGLRFSAFHYLGPGNVFLFEEGIPGERKEVISAEEADAGELIEDYYNIEPRLSAMYQLNRTSSVKASYNRMAQYIHLISNTTASNPLDVWTPSTNNIEPQISDQWVAGYFRNFKNNLYETSVEAYFRRNQHQIEYIDGADLLINEFLEGDLLSGRGRAYGVEFSVKKNKGRFTWWLSYTAARTELKVDGINNGEWYPTRYDQLHNLKLTGFYEINRRWSASANFSFLSGTPTTFPTSRFEVQEYLIPFNALEDRNNVRIPSYHRLDISATLKGKKTKHGKPRKNEDYWVFGLYNVYGRTNPFSIYFSQGTDRVPLDEPIPTSATQVSIIGTIIPAISYNFKF